MIKTFYAIFEYIALARLENNDTASSLVLIDGGDINNDDDIFKGVRT